MDWRRAAFCFFSLTAALSGRAFTLVNHSIRFYSPFTFWAIFAVTGEQASMQMAQLLITWSCGRAESGL